MTSLMGIILFLGGFIIGGLIITSAVVLHGFGAKRKREPITI